MKTTHILMALLLLVMACKSDNQVNSNENKTTMKTTVINQEEIDKENILLLTSTLFTATDNRNWEKVISTMADSVYVDYTSLGGDSGFKTSNEIVSGWQKILPGFERTVHHPHNFAIWSVGNRATATFDGHATHYLDGKEWSVFVGYDTEYIKEDDQWKLARIDATLYKQFGETSLPALAIQKVEEGKISKFVKADTNKIAVIANFFKALESRKLENILASFTTDALQIMPLSPENFPKELKGITEIKNQYKGVMSYEQTYEVEYFSTQNPNDYLAKYNGTITTNEGKPYNNSYIGLFTIENEKITKFIEYFNPNVLLNSWPGLKPLNYSVHRAGARTDSGVTLQEVTFNSNGVNLVGHLFLPPNFNSNKTYPASIVTGSWTSVKEQMPDEYASVMAKDGFITLTFDFTGFGESEGQPRQVEDYNIKIEDIKAAVDFLENHPNVDIGKLSALGVCASSGYMAHATAQDPRIKKLVLVAPWLHNPQIAKAIYDLRPGGTEGLLKAAKDAKVKYAETGVMDYVLAASELDPLSAMYVPEGAFDYYLNPAKAAGNHYDNRFAVSSWEPWLNFDGISAGNEIKQPVFIVHSESGAVPQGAKAFYELLEGKKDIVWLNQFNQQQLYFEKEAVNTAMKEVINYLK
ncbi:nuclear transport factor 2 family protein [Winogradskyella sp.]|uniref:nuclear transport factor 2 family protein n=1 Tax=Winogradskyella sp. TaxID=1883156 RepID=UPI00260DBDDF|nr:nuclear transport factor 2 family protein [Winogradskyella sp.]